MTLIMANGSGQQPFGIIEDMLEWTNKFTFPTNFVVMEMEECKEVPLLKTTRIVIDVDKGRVKLQMQNEILVMHL